MKFKKEFYLRLTLKVYRINKLWIIIQQITKNLRRS